MRALFIGNSHTYMNDMPYLFQEIYHDSFHEEAEAFMLAYSGRDLAWHRKEYFSYRYQLLYGKLDWCFIQQAAHPFPDEETTIENGKALIELSLRCGVEPVLFMTWAEKACPENQQKMIDTYLKLGEMTGIKVAPVGIAWQKIRQKYPQIELYYKDGEHASPYGDLLTALTLCKTIHPEGTLALPKKIIDFQVAFDREYPEACMDASGYIPYDHVIGRKILDVVEQL